MNWLDKLIDLIQKYLPALFVGYKIGKAGKEELQKENTNLKLELKGAKDADRIEDHNRNLTDNELHDEIVRGFAGKPDKK